MIFQPSLQQWLMLTFGFRLTLALLAGLLVCSKFSLLDFYSLCPNHRSHELIYLVNLLASGAQMVIGVYLSREVCEIECAQNLGMFLFHYVGFILVPITTLMLTLLCIHNEQKRIIQYCCVGGGVGDGVGNA